MYLGVFGLVVAVVLIGLALFLHQSAPVPETDTPDDAAHQQQSPPKPPPKRPALDR